MNSKSCRTRTRVYEASRDKHAATIGEDGDGVSTFSYLTDLIPSSILPEVFYGLGIKDIMRCKCVCKLFYKLISEPNFSASYAKSSKLTPLLFYERDSRFQEHLYLLEFAEPGVCSQTPIVPKLPGWLRQDPKLPEKESDFHIVGSCNGLVCWNRNIPGNGNSESASVDTVYITNPIVGGYIALPERYRGDGCYSRYISGSSGNNIKVLRICFLGGHIGRFKMGKCEIFAVGVDDNWRDVPSVSGLASYTKMVAFNGVVHWIPKGRFSNVVSTFDLVEEKMSQIIIPDRLGLDSRPVELEVFNNQVCLVDYGDISHSQITIWKMQEYSVAESWTKTVILKSWFPTYMQPYRFRSIAELKVGDMLFADSACVLNCLVSYNIQQDKFSIIENFTSGKMMASRFHSYSPSFFQNSDDL